MSSLIPDAGRASRMLSWNMPIKTYYSSFGRVACPSCSSTVNLRDLFSRKGSVCCKNCKN